jgi:hypothetical protein
MKVKALILGALPLPYEGPWVDLEGSDWRVETSGDFGGNVIFESRDPRARSGPSGIPLDGSNLAIMNGKFARIVIPKKFDYPGRISVKLICIGVGNAKLLESELSESYGSASEATEALQ